MKSAALSIAIGMSAFAGNAAKAATVDGTTPLPHDLSVWGMFAQADWVVKLVMLGLIAASVVTWTVLVAKHMELGRNRQSAEQARRQLEDARSLNDLPDAVRSSALLAEAYAEITATSGSLDDREGLKERLISRLDRHEARLARKMTQGVTILGTIGAVAPFVGLFGTVWGIMNAFIGISEQQTTNLAVVAPGIAEALLATALGLVAAIPAVVIYNHFARQIAAHRAVIGDSSAALLRLVSRDLSRGTLPTRSANDVAG